MLSSKDWTIYLFIQAFIPCLWPKYLSSGDLQRALQTYTNSVSHLPWELGQYHHCHLEMGKLSQREVKVSGPSSCSEEVAVPNSPAPATRNMLLPQSCSCFPCLPSRLREGFTGPVMVCCLSDVSPCPSQRKWWWKHNAVLCLFLSISLATHVAW